MSLTPVHIKINNRATFFLSQGTYINRSSTTVSVLILTQPLKGNHSLRIFLSFMCLQCTRQYKHRRAISSPRRKGLITTVCASSRKLFHSVIVKNIKWLKWIKQSNPIGFAWKLFSYTFGALAIDNAFDEVMVESQPSHSVKYLYTHFNETIPISSPSTIKLLPCLQAPQISVKTLLSFECLLYFLCS